MQRREFWFVLLFVVLIFMFAKNDESGSSQSLSVIRPPNDFDSGVVLVLEHDCSAKQDSDTCDFCVEIGGSVFAFDFIQKKSSKVDSNSENKNNDDNNGRE